MDTRLIRILAKASDIPLGALVTKLTGQKEYVISDKVVIYGLDKSQNQTIPASDGVRFITAAPNEGASSSAVNAVSGDTVLVWHASRSDVQDMLDADDANG